jgi:hypothetical protein
VRQKLLVTAIRRSPSFLAFRAAAREDTDGDGDGRFSQAGASQFRSTLTLFNLPRNSSST